MEGEELSAALRRGSHAAFSRWMGAFQERVHRFARRRLGDADEAWDAVQDAFTAAFRSRGSLPDDPRRRDSWLLGIAANKVGDLLRRRGRRPVTALPPDLAAPDDPARSAVARDAHARVVAALGSAPEVNREALLMAAVDGLSYAEIAAVQGCPVGTVRSRIAAARAHLRGRLGPPGEVFGDE